MADQVIEVNGVEYHFPDSMDDNSIKQALIKQGVIAGGGPSGMRGQVGTVYEEGSEPDLGILPGVNRMLEHVANPHSAGDLAGLAIPGAAPALRMARGATQAARRGATAAAKAGSREGFSLPIVDTIQDAMSGTRRAAASAADLAGDLVGHPMETARRGFRKVGSVLRPKPAPPQQNMRPRLVKKSGSPLVEAVDEASRMPSVDLPEISSGRPDRTITPGGRPATTAEEFSRRTPEGSPRSRVVTPPVHPVTKLPVGLRPRLASSHAPLLEDELAAALEAVRGTPPTRVTIRPEQTITPGGPTRQSGTFHGDPLGQSGGYTSGRPATTAVEFATPVPPSSPRQAGTLRQTPPTVDDIVTRTMNPPPVPLSDEEIIALIRAGKYEGPMKAMPRRTIPPPPTGRPSAPVSPVADAPPAAGAPPAEARAASPTLRIKPRRDEHWGPGSTDVRGQIAQAEASPANLLYDPQTPTSYIREQLRTAPVTDSVGREFLARVLRQRYHIEAGVLGDEKGQVPIEVFLELLAAGGAGAAGMAAIQE